MTKCHFDAADIIAEAITDSSNNSSQYAATHAINMLRDAGYIIVRRGAIGEAQREAVAQYREDNDNKPAPPKDWYAVMG